MYLPLRGGASSISGADAIGLGRGRYSAGSGKEGSAPSRKLGSVHPPELASALAA